MMHELKIQTIALKSRVGVFSRIKKGPARIINKISNTKNYDVCHKLVCPLHNNLGDDILTQDGARL